MIRKLLLSSLGLLSAVCMAQTTANAYIDATKAHQKITGFGAFVCSPQFQYNHMSDTEIGRVWGKTSTVGCNIMRVFLPIGRNAWGQSLSTIKKAKQKGLIVFASPWGQPAEWKTNNSSNCVQNGVEGYLKKENWADYAKYLDDYVKYLRQNGVELDAISIQNEPDWKCEYAGCLWSPNDMAEFVKTYGKTISCKVITPETLAVRDDYVNALNKTDVLESFDIYGGHQYGGIQSAYKNLGTKGKEIWMTEYLINWDEEEHTTRNYDFSKDFFNFFRAINVCMLGDFNAWIHYTAKRYYGLMGDGQKNAGSSGAITKRGYIMAHFAKHVTGMTRIDSNFGGLEGSAYLSQTGDTVVAVMANTSTDAVDLSIDLPFYTKTGKIYTTTKTSNYQVKTLTETTETCRPKATVAAQSVVTVLFVKSRDRQPSSMTGSISYFERPRIDDLTTTKSAFGTAYKLSGKTKTFNHNSPLISSRTDASNGYVKLNEGAAKLVFEVTKLTSNMNYSSAITTLVYVNGKGQVATHNYGDLEFPAHENFKWVFDLSTATLADGCTGLISLTNNNWSSNLSFTFADVYVTSGNTQYVGTLKGSYLEDDRYLLDFINDASCTSVDMTAVTGMPATLPWLEATNRLAYVGADSPLSGSNVVKGNVCPSLVVNEAWGAFRPAKAFTATNATYTCTVNGQHIVQLPFTAAVPAGVTVYTLTADLQPVAVTGMIPANQPLLVEAQGEVTFQGSGDIVYVPCTLTDAVLPIVTPTAISAPRAALLTVPCYDLNGMRVNTVRRGVIINNGHKYLIK